MRPPLTQAQMYTQLIPRPKMTEKLLSRPPFRYLFDIVQETIKATNFGNGLYSEEEGNSKNYQVRSPN